MKNSAPIMATEFFLVCIFIYKSIYDGSENNFNVKNKAPILNIKYIMADSIFDRCISPQPFRLRQTRNTWSNMMLHHILRNFFLELLYIKRTFWPRPHYTHMPHQHVKKLRQLV